MINNIIKTDIVKKFLENEKKYEKYKHLGTKEMYWIEFAIADYFGVTDINFIPNKYKSKIIIDIASYYHFIEFNAIPNFPDVNIGDIVSSELVIGDSDMLECYYLYKLELNETYETDFIVNDECTLMYTWEVVELADYDNSETDYLNNTKIKIVNLKIEF